MSQRAVKNLGKIPSDTPEPVAMSEVSHMISEDTDLDCCLLLQNPLFIYIKPNLAFYWALKHNSIELGRRGRDTES